MKRSSGYLNPNTGNNINNNINNSIHHPIDNTPPAATDNSNQQKQANQDNNQPN